MKETVNGCFFSEHSVVNVCICEVVTEWAWRRRTNDGQRYCSAAWSANSLRTTPFPGEISYSLFTVFSRLSTVALALMIQCCVCLSVRNVLWLNGAS